MIIGNLPSGFDLSYEDGIELKSMIENIVTFVSIDQASIGFIRYGVVTVTLGNQADAVNVATTMDGQLFHNVPLRVSHKDI